MVQEQISKGKQSPKSVLWTAKMIIETLQASLNIRNFLCVKIIVNIPICSCKCWDYPTAKTLTQLYLINDQQS